MVDKIDKALHKMSPKMQKVIIQLVKKILNDNLSNLDVKKLKTRDNVFRVRKGVYRIIFYKRSDKDTRIISIEKRSDTTYN